MLGSGPNAQNAEQQQRFEAERAEQEGGRRGPGGAVVKIIHYILRACVLSCSVLSDSL